MSTLGSSKGVWTLCMSLVFSSSDKFTKSDGNIIDLKSQISIHQIFIYYCNYRVKKKRGGTFKL